MISSFIGTLIALAVWHHGSKIYIWVMGMAVASKAPLTKVKEALKEKVKAAHVAATEQQA